MRPYPRPSQRQVDQLMHEVTRLQDQVATLKATQGLLATAEDTIARLRRERAGGCPACAALKAGIR